MKKFFMKESGEELQFGDMIEVDLTKEMDNGTVKHHHLECKFIEPLIPLLLEENIIEVRELEDVSDEEEMDDCTAIYESLDIVISEIKELRKSVKTLINMLMSKEKSNAKPAGK